MIGSIVEFKRRGFTSWVLGGILKLFEPSWDGWGWHMAIKWLSSYKGWYVLEAQAQGVNVNWYSDEWLAKNTRSWDWLDGEPTSLSLGKFIREHNSQKYDVAIYFWTALQYLIRHFFNRRIPRLLDERWSCWELAFWFCRDMGKPIQSIYDCPMITDAVRAFRQKQKEDAIKAKRMVIYVRQS